MDYVYLYGIIEKEHERRTTPSSYKQLRPIHVRRILQQSEPGGT